MTEPVFTHLDEGTDPLAWQPWRDGLPLVEPWRNVDRLVVVAAHPDDETLAVGGLMASCARRGVEVVLVSATWGEQSHPDSPTHRPEHLLHKRRAEMVRALRALSPEARHVALELPDGRLREHHAELIAGIRHATGKTPPERLLIVSTWEGDGHPDHQAAGVASREVARSLGCRHAQYPLWLWQWGEPTSPDLPEAVKVHLGKPEQERKREAVAAHVSQHTALSQQPGDEPILGRALLAQAALDTEVLIPVDPAQHDVAAIMDQVHAEADPWNVDDSFYEARKRALTLACLPRKHYHRALEVGCSVGALSQDLAPRCDELIAVDVSPRAVEAARERLAGLEHVQVAEMHVPHEWPEGRLDLVVISETGYYLNAAQLEDLAGRLQRSLSAEGVLLLCHWRHPIDGWPLDAADVHARLTAIPGWEPVVRHQEPDITIDVLQRVGRPSPAQAEGLL